MDNSGDLVFLTLILHPMTLFYCPPSAPTFLIPLPRNSRYAFYPPDLMLARFGWGHAENPFAGTSNRRRRCNTRSNMDFTRRTWSTLRCSSLIALPVHLALHPSLTTLPLLYETKDRWTHPARGRVTLGTKGHLPGRQMVGLC